MKSTVEYAAQLHAIEEHGVIVMRDISQFSIRHEDFVCPHMTLMLCTSGIARSLYDMREVSQRTYDLSCVLPGHIIHPMENSEDFRSTIIVLSHRIYKDLQFHTFSHDYEKFNLAPICSLSEEQTHQMLALTEQLEKTAAFTEEELPHRFNMMLSILAIGYEYLNYYRREQDIAWQSNRNAAMLSTFCDLVVTHYRESREVKYYAELMHLTPKYFSKIISTLTGGQSPADWIEQYVAAQAKHILRTQPVTIKEAAYRLGFTESASFCRFFKRVTGLTPQEYKAG